MDQQFENLIKVTQQLHTGESHIHHKNVKGMDGVSCVLSVFNNQKPAHLVLEELYEWGQENDPKLIEKIKEIELDMSWNKQGSQIIKGDKI